MSSDTLTSEDEWCARMAAAFAVRPGTSDWGYAADLADLREGWLTRDCNQRSRYLREWGEWKLIPP